jgi:GGDEF domain-containing protein
MPPAPVADVPPRAIADGIEPAKGWLLALIAARDLQDAAAIPTAELARDAPTLCAAILRAVGSDAELELPPLAARAGAMAGAGSPASAVAAVGLLRGALWESLRATMPRLDAATTAALAERLAWVCDLVAAATVSAPRGAEREPPDLRVRDTRSRHGAGAEGSGPDAAAANRGPREAAAPAPDVRPHDAAPLAADVGPYDAPASSAEWRAAAARLLADGRGFALLALEVDDAARLLAADAHGAAAAIARAHDAVRGELRPDDVLGHEGDGRVWVVAAELGASGGRALAERFADAVAGAATLRGAPLSVSVGIAAAPADGTDLEDLAAHADEALFAARAAGRPIA